MFDSISRRGFLSSVPAIPLLVSGPSGRQSSAVATTVPWSGFPAHEPEMVKEIVGASHGNLARVKELVTVRPALARASWDWGFGDWETAIDAASHVGNRPIAEFLLANGARPTIFTAVMMGHLTLVKHWVEAIPGVQRMRGPHGLTMMVHARAGGAANVEMVKYLESLGDADPQYPNVPLTEAEQAAIPGDYSFGPGASDRLTVVKGSRGFTIERPGGAARNLFHHGGLVFNPPGAEAVKISFELSGEKAQTLAIEDGARVTRARRI